MPTPDGSSTEKRMPVLVFGYGNTKLLGVQSIGKKLTGKYGKTVAEEVHKLLQVWAAPTMHTEWFLTLHLQTRV